MRKIKLLDLMPWLAFQYTTLRGVLVVGDEMAAPTLAVLTMVSAAISIANHGKKIFNFMKKFSIEQMENVNGGGACTEILRTATQASMMGYSELARDAFGTYLITCTILGNFIS